MIKSISGISILLGILFIFLKLIEFIDWSWWLVTLPFWGGFALILAIFILVFFFIIIKYKLNIILCFFGYHNFSEWENIDIIDNHKKRLRRKCKNCDKIEFYEIKCKL